MLQSERPTAESENRPSSGGVIAARASVIVRDRSVPNHGLARAPLADLRVVATRSVGRVASSEAPKRGPLADRPAQPPTASAVAADARPRSAVRRETAVRSGCMRRSFSRCGGGNATMAPGFLTPDRGDNRARAARIVVHRIDKIIERRAQAHPV